MKKQTLIGLIGVLIFSILALTYEASGPNADGSKMREMEGFSKEIPFYPGFMEVHNSSSSSGLKAHISRKFKSAASYEEIRNFYLEPITRLGWQLINERHVTDWGINRGGMILKFRRDDYKLSIQYAGKKANYGWDYSFNIGWGLGSNVTQ